MNISEAIVDDARRWAYLDPYDRYNEDAEFFRTVDRLALNTFNNQTPITTTDMPADPVAQIVPNWDTIALDEPINEIPTNLPEGMQATWANDPMPMLPDEEDDWDDGDPEDEPEEDEDENQGGAEDTDAYYEELTIKHIGFLHPRFKRLASFIRTGDIDEEAYLTMKAGQNSFGAFMPGDMASADLMERWSCALEDILLKTFDLSEELLPCSSPKFTRLYKAYVYNYVELPVVAAIDRRDGHPGRMSMEYGFEWKFGQFKTPPAGNPPFSVRIWRESFNTSDVSQWLDSPPNRGPQFLRLILSLISEDPRFHMFASMMVHMADKAYYYMFSQEGEINPSLAKWNKETGLWEVSHEFEDFLVQTVEKYDLFEISDSARGREELDVTFSF